LYNLTAYPQYVRPIREEVDTVVREHGWTKETMALLRKADSFLAEILFRPPFGSSPNSILSVAFQA
ncbi:hypothetical protein EDC04DRAFT_2586909, partial [Pisolithus marmoratus]